MQTTSTTRHALRPPRLADELELPVRFLTPREIRHERLKLALEMFQLVLGDPMPQTLRAPVECLKEFLEELLVVP